jgi:hypothetical protein
MRGRSAAFAATLGHLLSFPTCRLGQITVKPYGEPEAAIESEERAMRLSPHDTEAWSMHAAMAYALFFSGRYAEAVSWAEMAGRENPSLALAAGVAAASSALADLPEEASKAMARVRQIDRELRLSNLKALFPLRRSEDFTRWAEGMRKAGLPE